MAGEILTIEILAVLVTVAAKAFWSASLWWVIPNFFALFLAWGAYRMFIYERYINPLSKLPGPKVRLSCNLQVNGLTTTAGSLAVGTISNDSEGRTRRSTVEMATRVPKSNWLSCLSRPLLLSSDNANFDYGSATHSQSYQHLRETQTGSS